MKFSCDQCQAQYMIADEKVGSKGVKVRCKKCSHIISVTKDSAIAETPGDAAGAAGSNNAFDDMFGASGGGDEGGGAFERSPTKVFTTSELDKVRQEQDLARTSGGEPSAAAGKAEWYVAIADEQVGPVSVAELEARWDRGDISAASLAWRAGLPDWSPISTVAELQALLSRPQAKQEPAKVALEAPKEEKKEVVTWRPSGASALADLVKDAAVEEPKKPEPAASESPFGNDFNPQPSGGDPFGSPAFAGAAAATGPSTVWQFPASTAKKKDSGSKGVIIALASVVVVLGAGAAAYFGGLIGPKPAPQPPATPPVAVAPAVLACPPGYVQPAGQAVCVPVALPTQPPPAATGAVAATGAAQPAAAPTETKAVAKKDDDKQDKVKGGKGKKGRGSNDDDDDDKRAAAPPAPEPKKTASKGDAMDDLLGGGGGSAPKKATLGRDEVLSTVKSNMGSIKACVDAYSRGGGKLPPKLIAKWVIKPSGFTDGQEMASPELKGTPVDGCVVSAIKKWRFAEFGGSPIPVTFPFPVGQ